MTLSLLNDKLPVLLAPLPGDDPAGPALRYDRVMSEIRAAREADDPSLPQGEWERPLKKADWPLVAQLCGAVLGQRSKDLQCAAWLTEAWVHLHQIDGLQAGVALLGGLLENHWDDLHPRIDEDGDSEARVAPLFWLNETLPVTLRLHLCLMHWPERKPSRLTQDEWEKAPVQDDPDEDDSRSRARSRGNAGESEPLPSRADFLRQAAAMPVQPLLAAREQIRGIAAAWQRLDRFIDEKLGNDAPSLSRVSDALAQIERLLTTLIAGRTADASVSGPLAAQQAPAQTEDAGASVASPAGQGAPDAGGPGDLGSLQPVHCGQSPALGVIDSRETAYRLLETVADYLMRTEPHSPTPYLITRAVSWGRMPLPELMNEIVREEGDLNRLFTLLGLNRDR